MVDLNGYKVTTVARTGRYQLDWIMGSTGQQESIASSSSSPSSSVDQWNVRWPSSPSAIFQALSLSCLSLCFPFFSRQTLFPVRGHCNGGSRVCCVNSSETDKLWPALRERCLLLFFFCCCCCLPTCKAAHSAADCTFRFSFTCSDHWKKLATTASMLSFWRRRPVHFLPMLRISWLVKCDQVILACFTWPYSSHLLPF